MILRRPQLTVQSQPWFGLYSPIIPIEHQEPMSTPGGLIRLHILDGSGGVFAWPSLDTMTLQPTFFSS